jgi:three-Cys-motif partner protein
MQVPREYQGREQSFLKHRVLHEYLLSWGIKLGSIARGRRVRLCYVDGFAGPWKAQSAALEDTSIAIGLDALEAAAKTWRDQGALIDVEAAFVEKDDTAFGDLEKYLKGRAGTVKTLARHGEFGSFVPELQKWLGTDSGLIFVDPTGWRGAAMRFIAPLVAGTRPRDVLVNVMFDHINRFKDDPRAFLREQMRDFFGLGETNCPTVSTRSNCSRSTGPSSRSYAASLTPQTSRSRIARWIGPSFVSWLAERTPRS